jgi:hypothetical protein
MSSIWRPPGTVSVGLQTTHFKKSGRNISLRSRHTDKLKVLRCDFAQTSSLKAV